MCNLILSGHHVIYCYGITCLRVICKGYHMTYYLRLSNNYTLNLFFGGSMRGPPPLRGRGPNTTQENDHHGWSLLPPKLGIGERHITDLPGPSSSTHCTLLHWSALMNSVPPFQAVGAVLMTIVATCIEQLTAQSTK